MFILICVVVGFLAMAYLGFRDRDVMGSFFWLLSGVFGALLGFLLGLMVSMIVLAASPTHLETLDTTNIVNIRDDSEISGSFFLIAGSVDEEAVFKYYTEKNGNYRLVTRDADRVTIRQDGSQPRVITRAEVSDWTFFTLPGDDPDKGGVWDVRYIIHIPEGSIKQDFVLGE